MSMSPEERQMLTELFERVRGQAGAQRDKEAETFIADAVRAQPYAPYLLAQAVLVQEQALKGADQKIRDLETRLAQAQQPAQQEPPQSGGFLSGLFGGGAARPAAPQPSPWGQPAQPQPGPQAAQPGPWGAPQAAGGGGSSFLKGALGAAAGVAGGVLLADTLKGVFGGHSGGGFMGGGGVGGGETIVNNYYEEPRGGGQDYQDAGYQDDGGYSGDDSYGGGDDV
ncbi:hypothetical protein GGD83_000721 [Rhodoblastus sphagnicola]|nr:DUF2076 domain-containing protein [Rhodoblastus sphagnicola]MBB4196944.1 hypothetical protein [Rhodoblastus sphagnicola]